MSQGRLLAVIVIAIVATGSAYVLGTQLRPGSQPVAARTQAGNVVIAPSALVVGAGRTRLLDAAQMGLTDFADLAADRT